MHLNLYFKIYKLAFALCVRLAIIENKLKMYYIVINNAFIALVLVDCCVDSQMLSSGCSYCSIS